MPLNKKEKAAFDELLLHHKLKGALHWSPRIRRDVPPPARGPGGETSGFDFNSYSLNVFEAWSSSVSHGEGPMRTKHSSGTQNPRSLYSTRLLALHAMRHDVAMAAAKKLLEIDERIEAEENRAP